MKTLTNLTYLKIKSVTDIFVSKYKKWGFEEKMLYWVIKCFSILIFISFIPMYEIDQDVYYSENRNVYNIETQVVYHSSWYRAHRIYDHDLNIKDRDKLIEACQKERTIAEDFKKAHKKVN